MDWISLGLVLGYIAKLDDEPDAFVYHICRYRQKEGLPVLAKAEVGI